MPKTVVICRKNENVYFELRGFYDDHFHSTSGIVFNDRINIHVSLNVQCENKNITIFDLKPIIAVINDYHNGLKVNPIPPYR